MSHTSPATFLVWAILSSLLGSFLLFHLWSFDRFKCLKWNNGPYSGAFKRIMTYSYLISVPTIMVYAIGFAVIKYRQGFIFFPGHGVIPKPYQLWPKSQQDIIFPFYLLFSIGWSLEMVTHLEELCFWLFLVNAGSIQQDWFRSLYFKTWIVGSVAAVLYMPLVTIFTRSNPLRCEAFTFLAGSLGSLCLTLWFTPILWTFPSFLRNLKREGVDMNTVVRLTKFHELNTLRVFFRFLFVVPLLCLGIDGVRPHQHVNESMFWTDVLAMVAGFGCVISSGITLVIFFPRSIEGEIAAKQATRDKKLATQSRMQQSMVESQDTMHIHSQYSATGGTYLLSSSPVKASASLPDTGFPETSISPLPSNAPKKSWGRRWNETDDEDDDPQKVWDEERDIVPPAMPPRYTHTPHVPHTYQPQITLTEAPDDTEVQRVVEHLPMRPNRRAHDSNTVEMGGIGSLTEGNLSKHNQRMSKVNHMVHNFTSPIDLVYIPREASVPESRYTFTRRR